MIPLLAGKAAAGPVARLLLLAVVAGAVLFFAPDLLGVAVDAGGEALGAVIDAIVDAAMGVVDRFVGLVADKLNPF
ncbi:hypothetical protein [Halogeometricum borinquense]|uniref:hypothetical protein n=1 Tax=Halogeometricum borinquense TaxID=60847 RepID=UPI0034270974